MKKSAMLLTALATLPFAGMPASADLRIVALPRTGNARQIEHAVTGWALHLAPGDTMMVFDARRRSLIASISIPNDPTKARPDRKMPYIDPAMAAVRSYFAATPSSDIDGAVVDASSFLDEMGPIIASNGSGNVRIALIGSPWFTAPGALERKDYEGSFPSDGLILGDRSRSPLGTLGRHDLDGVTVDYCVTTGSASFLTTEQRDRVERAWGLIVAQRGGQLTTFSTDLESCFSRFGQTKAPDPKSYTIDQTDAQVFAMYKAKDVAPQILEAPPVKAAQSNQPANNRQAEAERFSQQSRTTPPSTLTGTAWIGIQWHEPVDLDLYVRCSTNAPFLFFYNQLTPEGRHNFDYRSGTGSAFETVDLTQPCADMSKAQVFVNFYAGRVTSPITGVVAVQFDGGIYKADFTMAALSGNNGRGLSGTADMGAPYWVKIDLPSLLRLNAGAQRRAAR